MDSLPHALRQGVDEFNRAYFFEAHETLEDLWRETHGPLHTFYQGLIQLAVGLYHLSNGNRRGARNQLEKGLAKLEGFQPVCQAIEVEALCRDVRRWLDRLQEVGDVDLAIDPEQLPKIRWIASEGNSACHSVVG
jgi:predicted metal-dependent hydrolase